MIVITLLVLGAAIGWWRAGKLGGNRADRMQYAAAHGIGLAVIGIFVTIILSRMS